MAPQTKLTKPIRELICKYVGLGVSMQAAAAEAGIGASTFYGWLKRGREAIRRAEQEAQFLATSANNNGLSEDGYPNSRKLVPSRDIPYVLLAESIEQALGHAEVGFTLKIAKGAEHDWKAAAWWLERRCAQNYGSRSELRIEREPAMMTNDELISELHELGFVQMSVVEGGTALALGRSDAPPSRAAESAACASSIEGVIDEQRRDKASS